MSQKEREIIQLGLQTFHLNLENNHYDAISDKLINDFEEKVTELKTKQSLDLKGDGFAELMEIHFLEKKMFAISEMKINYAYKQFEIHLKFLITKAYKEISEKKLHQWSNVKSALKTKGIDINKISDYNNINDLRNLNNSIKHSQNILDDEKLNIKEFQNKLELSYTDLIKFYNRIQKSSLFFLKSLANEIYKGIYEFEDAGLKKIE